MEDVEDQSLNVPEINLIDYVAEHSKRVPTVCFSRQQVSCDRSQLKIFQNKLHHAIGQLKKENCHGPMCSVLQSRFNDLIYKYGNVFRHQKFWRATRQAITELKRINRLELNKISDKIDEGLVNSQYSCEPTKEAMTCLGSMIIQRMIHLDRLRIYCIRAVYSCVGMAEVGHHVSVILLLITMNAELAAEAERQYLVGRKFYMYLAEFLHNVDENMPETTNNIPFDSEQEKSGQPSENFNFILAMTNLAEDNSKFIRDWNDPTQQHKFAAYKNVPEEEERSVKSRERPVRSGKMMKTGRKRRW